MNLLTFFIEAGNGVKLSGKICSNRFKSHSMTETNAVQMINSTRPESKHAYRLHDVASIFPEIAGPSGIHQ